MAQKTSLALRRALERIAADLGELGVRWAVVGGLAVGGRAEPRFTRDVDVAVAVRADAQAEALVHALRARGYIVHMSIEHTATGRLGTVRLTSSRAPGVLIDLLFAASGIEPEVVSRATPGEILDGLKLPLARREHLLAMKVLSQSARRWQDRADIEALVEAASPAELRRVGGLLRLITERGFARRTNLIAKWKRLHRLSR